jgi:hypothetical protein
MLTESDNFELNYEALGTKLFPVCDSFYYHSTCFFDAISFVVFICVYSLVTLNLEIYEWILSFSPVFCYYISSSCIQSSLKTTIHIYLDCSYFGINSADIVNELSGSNSEMNCLNVFCNDGLTMDT